MFVATEGLGPLLYLYVILNPGGASGASSAGLTYFLDFGGSSMYFGNLSKVE